MLISPPVIPLCFVHFFSFFHSLSKFRRAKSRPAIRQSYAHLRTHDAAEPFEEKNFKSPDKQFRMTRNYHDALSPTITGRYMFHGDFRGNTAGRSAKLLAGPAKRSH